MFTCSRAPARAIARATKIRPKLNDTNHSFDRTTIVKISTTPRRCTHHIRKPASPAKERQRADRDQLTRLLKESPGKRDARNFLKQFETPKLKGGEAAATAKAKQAASDVLYNEWGRLMMGVNLGNLYQPTIFSREPLPEKEYGDEEEDKPLHLALVKLRQPQSLEDHTLGGIAFTLSQLARLGLSTAVILDCDEDAKTDTTWRGQDYEVLVREQAERLVEALEEYNEPGAMLVEHALGYSSRANDLPSTVQVRGGVDVRYNFLLYPPLDDGIIPVILPFAYDTEFKRVSVEADDVLLALVREFGGITVRNSTEPTTDEEDSEDFERPILDRVIVLDPLGGIPSQNRSDGAHVFVNLEAEYGDIKKELQQLSTMTSSDTTANILPSLGSGNPFSKFVEDEIVSIPTASTQRIESSTPTRHIKNLDVMQRALKLLPPASSGLIITPPEAATKAIPDDSSTTPAKNPLLHNLLTDKPMISSSLPTTPAPHIHSPNSANPATFLKKGVPLTMIPDPRITGPWLPPSPSNPSIDLANDPRINFPKLEALINDSFRRKLHAKNYLNRISGRVAGIIIAGDYEGGAICTWETPSSLLPSSPYTSPSSRPPSSALATPDSPHYIPYLDKFAVLTSSQGSGGVSDIVWASLVRTCFPGGVVWRSRTSNPVNKWYVERAEGMWNLLGGEWTMFWTVGGVSEEFPEWGGEGSREVGVGEIEKGGLSEGKGKRMTRWDAYVDVCRHIVPSWDDGIDRVD